MSEPIVAQSPIAVDLVTLAHRHHLRPATAQVLAHLVLDADADGVATYHHTTGAAAVGLGSKSGRRTFRDAVEELAAAGLLTVLARPWGTRPGVLVLSCPTVDRAVDRARAVVQTSTSSYLLPAHMSAPGPSTEPPSTARARSKTPASARGPLFTAPARPHGGDLPSEDHSYLPTWRPASPDEEEVGRSGFAKDWGDDELDELLAELLEYCRRLSPPRRIVDRSQMIHRLTPYDRDGIRTAGLRMLAEARTDGTIRNPIALLCDRAMRLPEFFAPSTEHESAPAPLAQPDLVERSATPFTPAPEDCVRQQIASARTGLHARSGLQTVAAP